MKSILYAEDEALYGDAIKQLHEVVHRKFYGEVSFKVVPTWEDAMASMAEDRPSVFLLDLVLPPFTHEQILTRFVETQNLPPTLALTGNETDVDLRRRCILLGLDDFMFKHDANRNPELLCERLYHCFLRRLRDEAGA